jgi:hypothetical protein
MNRLFPFLLCVFAMSFAGCLTTPVADSGGGNGVTVTNSNVPAIVNAATNVFAQSGYTPGPGNYPASVSFEKPGGAFGQAMWGSYDNKQTIRAKLRMTQIPGTNDYRLSTQVFTVSDAGEAGFEDSRKIMFFAGQFKPLMRKIQVLASGAGPGY